jgi:hypothetical protein
MLAEVRDATDAKRLVDMARAAEIYCKRQKFAMEVIASATAIKIDAMTMLGEHLKVEEMTPAGRPSKIDSQKESISKIPTLAERGITLKESMYAQALVKVRESLPAVYERVRAGEVTVKLAPPSKPHNFPFSMSARMAARCLQGRPLPNSNPLQLQACPRGSRQISSAHPSLWASLPGVPSFERFA